MTAAELGVAAHARGNPGKPAVVAGDRRITYAELDARANQAARAFRRLGVLEGDRVAVALRNRLEFLEAATAAARLGAIVIPLSWRFKRDEVRVIVEDADARLVVAEQDARERMDGFPALHLGGPYEEAVAAEDEKPPEDGFDPAPVFFRYYTSGTTGAPKAIRRPDPSREAYLATATSYPQLAGLTGPDEVHLACGPLYHTAPCAFANFGLLLGHTVVLVEHFDAAAAMDLIERERVSWSHMVPINFVRILALPEAVRRGRDVSSVKRILHAAAPCPPDVKQRIIDLFPPDTVWEYYGMTEGLATLIPPDEWLRKPGSVGRAAQGIDLVILGDDGRELPAGEVGLVYVSPMGGVRFEYGNAPEKTAQAWLGERYTVGDMGYLDEDGYLFLTDRKVDMIISGGANIYPAEVEAVLFRHPAVGDVAVIGIPDDEWGEAVLAVVEPRAPVEAADLIAFCRENLAHYKCPRRVELVEKLPRDESGKVRKRELRDPYWAGRNRKI
ncbi:MAG TPA: AMP-binding protein [Actinomycetota bacterium]|nr:AMP-binding protein [Actinomycetota bacterium]